MMFESISLLQTSPCFAQTGPLQVENRGFHAGVRRWAGGAVGRDAQALVGSAGFLFTQFNKRFFNIWIDYSQLGQLLIHLIRQRDTRD
jgi:hypothetical protein